LAEEQPSKKTKSSIVVKAPEEGGSELQPVEEEVEGVLGKRTRENQEVGPSPIQAPRVPKKPRKKAARKLKYTSEVEEQEINEMVDQATDETAKEL